MGDIYADDELATMLTQVFEIKVGVSDIKQPKAEFVQRLYLMFIRDFGASLEQINQPLFDTCDEMVQQHPDMYRGVFRVMSMARVIKYFFQYMHDDNSFMPADLFDPKPKRTKKWLSLFMDFYYTANDPSEQINNFDEAIAFKQETRANHQAAILKLKARLSEMKLANAESQIREDDEMKRMAEVKRSFQDVQEQKVNLKAELESCKMDISNYITAIKGIELEIIEAEEKCGKLASQVVQASERQEIEEREYHLAACKSENSLKIERLTELTQNLRIYTSAAELLSNQLLSILKETEREVIREREIATELAQIEHTKRGSLEEVDDCVMKFQHIKEQVLAKQEKISQMQQAWELKKVALQEDINQNTRDLENSRRHQTEEDIVAQELELDYKKVTTDISQFNEQVKNFDNLIGHLYQRILLAMEKHQNQLQVTLSDVSQTIHEAKEKIMNQ